MYSHQVCQLLLLTVLYVCMLYTTRVWRPRYILLQGSVSLFVTENGSTIVTYSCDSGYSLNGSTTSLCVLGEWTPSPETVTCIAEKDNVTSMPGEMERDGVSNI